MKLMALVYNSAILTALSGFVDESESAALLSLLMAVKNLMKRTDYDLQELDTLERDAWNR